MARALLAVLLVAMAVSGLIFVGGLQLALATNVSSIIASDTTWTKANSPYNLVGNVLVNNGVTLTIEPGVTVNLNSYYIMVNGTLTARGTSDDQIRFNGGSITFNSFKFNNAFSTFGQEVFWVSIAPRQISNFCKSFNG